MSRRPSSAGTLVFAWEPDQGQVEMPKTMHIAGREATRLASRQTTRSGK